MTLGFLSPLSRVSLIAQASDTISPPRAKAKVVVIASEFLLQQVFEQLALVMQWYILR
jgi:hypothetical protein